MRFREVSDPLEIAHNFLHTAADVTRMLVAQQGLDISLPVIGIHPRDHDRFGALAMIVAFQLRSTGRRWWQVVARIPGDELAIHLETCPRHVVRALWDDWLISPDGPTVDTRELRVASGTPYPQPGTHSRAWVAEPRVLETDRRSIVGILNEALTIAAGRLVPAFVATRSRD